MIMFYKRQRIQQNECRSKCLVTIVPYNYSPTKHLHGKERTKEGAKRKEGIYKKDSKHCSFLSVSFAHLYIKKNWYVKDQRFFISFNIAAQKVLHPLVLKLNTLPNSRGSKKTQCDNTSDAYLPEKHGYSMLLYWSLR